MEDAQLYGRTVVWPKIKPVPDHVQQRPAIVGNACQRCGQRQLAALPRQQVYCQACIQLGRVSSLDVLLTLPEPNRFPPSPGCQWTGELTAAQQQVSQALIATWRARQRRLVWAVTGAGKTEMLFPLLNAALLKGDRVALVSPRLDVINELAPRLRAAFPGQGLMVLHGRVEEPYQYTQLVLATVHQLLRFYQAFDLIIIDEVDSYPYQGDAMLAQAVRQAAKSNHCEIYLTATPTRALRQAIKQGELAVSYLPLRFHRHLLPNITIQRCGDWRKRQPRRLKEQVGQLALSGRPFLIFVPQVADLAVMAAYLADFKQLQGHTVHAQDPERTEKIEDLRAGRVQYLVTTTILERGVTFKGIDVVIIGAEERVFTENALVQIAGRVGRSAERPTGEITAYARYHNWALAAAQRQIKAMNARGQELLDHG
ncbi:helicase-related protein [Lactobacillaceae bacterium L1_55_11]|nr:helicase-related protein [Lactobacillaceae bacterium L1_55_11]